MAGTFRAQLDAATEELRRAPGEGEELGMVKADTPIRSHANTWRRAMRSALLLATAAVVGACPKPPKPTPPALPFVIGPMGRWSGSCTLASTPPGSDRELSGCIIEFMFKPGSVIVKVQTSGLGALDSLHVVACPPVTACTAGKTVRATLGSGPNYSVIVPLPSPAGIARICATIEYLDPTTRPPTRPYKSLPLGCIPVSPTLTAAVGAFKITPTIDGLKHEGWFIDPTTDSPAQIILGRGLNPSTTVTAVAGGADTRSRQPWPGFSDQHGFTATLPYVGSPAATQVCVWRGPNTGTALGSPLGCFGFQEQTAAYADASVTRGGTLPVSVRNVPAGAVVSVNLRAAGGHFWLPWKHPAIWKTTADASGSANINVATDYLPPGQYAIAYSCAPECPGGGLNANQLIGGQPWTETIKWGPLVTINPGVSRGLSATRPSPNKVRVTGAGFRAGETVGVFVVPPLANFDGFPHEATPVAYTEADAQGRFTIDVDVTGLPMTGGNNQVIAFDSSNRPVAAITFTSP
jgi:hypothetical protein